MAEDAQTLLLRDLHAGRTSRNREFERFADRSARRTLRGYRRVRSLLRELRAPGVEAWARLLAPSGARAVEVFLRGLRYHRVVFLTPAEFALLVEELGAGAPPADAD